MRTWPPGRGGTPRSRAPASTARSPSAPPRGSFSEPARFHIVEYEQGRLFTDEARLPGARMGHRHLVESIEGGGSRLANTIYIQGALAPFWGRIMGPRAAKALPEAQHAVVAIVS